MMKPLAWRTAKDVIIGSSPLSFQLQVQKKALRLECFFCTPTGIRTPVLALKGLRPSPLDDGGGYSGQNSTIARLTGQVIFYFFQVSRYSGPIFVPSGKTVLLGTTMMPSRTDQVSVSISVPRGKGLIITFGPILAFLSIIAPSI